MRATSWFGTISAMARVLALASGVFVGVACKSEPPAAPVTASVAAGVAKAPRASWVDENADCNDPDSHDHACTDLTPEIIARLHANGYPYYVGHAEPTAEYFSRAGTSGYNMKWKVQLPASEPTPTQDGTKTNDFQLFVAQWKSIGGKVHIPVKQ